jgi:hypothetical protein
MQLNVFSKERAMFHIENPISCNSVSKFLFPIYMKLNIFRAERCQVEYTLSDNVQQLHVQQPSTYAKPEAASAVLGSW